MEARPFPWVINVNLAASHSGYYHFPHEESKPQKGMGGFKVRQLIKVGSGI